MNGGSAFRDVAADVRLDDPHRTVGAAWFAYEEDGNLDVFVANMNDDPNGLFRNDGGTFTDVAAEAGVADGGPGLGDESLGTVRPCVVDFNNDRLLDLGPAHVGRPVTVVLAG